MREARIMDGYFGRTLPEMLLARGVELRFAEIDAATGRPGEAEYEWLRTALLEATAKLVAAGVIDAATRRIVEEFFLDGRHRRNLHQPRRCWGTQTDLTHHAQRRGR
jgi:hypothetical protein